MEAYTNIYFNMNNNEDANKAAAIMKKIASNRVPEYPDEINGFINGIVVEENTVNVDDSCSLFCETFCELIPQIMLGIARYDFGPSTMKAWYFSCNRGSEAAFSGKIYKNGKFRMSFREHE